MTTFPAKFGHNYKSIKSYGKGLRTGYELDNFPAIAINGELVRKEVSIVRYMPEQQIRGLSASIL